MMITLTLPFEPLTGSLVLDSLARNAGRVVESEKLKVQPGQPQQWLVRCDVKEGTGGHQVFEPTLDGVFNG